MSTLAQKSSQEFTEEELEVFYEYNDVLMVLYMNTVFNHGSNKALRLGCDAVLKRTKHPFVHRRVQMIRKSAFPVGFLNQLYRELEGR